MKKVFIDTSILIAASKSKIGGARYILMQCRKGLLQGYISRYVIYEAKKQVQLTQLEKQRLNFFLLQCRLRIVDEPETAEIKKYYTFIEEEDAPIVAAAKLMNVDSLITLNTRDFMSKKLKEYAQPMEIVTPKGFIKVEKDR